MSKKKWIVVIINSLIFILLATLYKLDSIKYFDDFFYNGIIFIKNSQVTTIFKLFTMIGGIIGNIILINFILIINKKKGLYLLLDIGLIILLNTIFKNIFMRERPIGINIILEKGYSFPSGHSMTAVAVYGLIIYYLYHSRYKKHTKIAFIILASITMLLIPISRVYLGVHYFSDIIAGSCLAIIWLMFYTEYLKRKGI